MSFSVLFNNFSSSTYELNDVKISKYIAIKVKVINKINDLKGIRMTVVKFKKKIHVGH